MTPPQRLRQALIRLRRLGFDFDRAFPIAAGYAVRGETGDSALWWTGTWLEQREAWAAAYAGEPGRRLVLMTADDDASGFARRKLPELAA
ncbi:MAG: hypothetical protein JW895_16655 [Thermoleophilaceae bacterium]|nr:hypothetical protein [Thermoleophilaceae bacterium]